MTAKGTLHFIPIFYLKTHLQERWLFKSFSNETDNFQSNGKKMYWSGCTLNVHIRGHNMEVSEYPHNLSHHHCYTEYNVSARFIMLTHNPQCYGIRKLGLWKVTRWYLHECDNILTRETLELPYPFHHMNTQQENSCL